MDFKTIEEQLPFLNTTEKLRAFIPKNKIYTAYPKELDKLQIGDKVILYDYFNSSHSNTVVSCFKELYNKPVEILDIWEHHFTVRFHNKYTEKIYKSRFIPVNNKTKEKYILEKIKYLQTKFINKQLKKKEQYA